VNLTQNIYFSFASATKVRVLCYVLAQYVTVRDDKILQMKTLHCIIKMVVNARC